MVRFRASVLVGLVVLVGVIGLLALPGGAMAHVVERASVATGGAQGDHMSYLPVLSGDGRYVAFTSAAENLVPGDTNGADDVFVRDRVAGTTERVSIATDGTQANDHCGVGGSAISADGRYVVFRSDASNLVSGGADGFGQILVRDRVAGTTELVSVGTGGGDSNNGCFAPDISADGRYVAFASYSSDLVAGDTNGRIDVFVRDLVAGTTVLVSVSSAEALANDDSWDCAISGDGGYVAFQSSASNLIAGDNNACDDIFVRDLVAGTTERVSISNNEYQANQASYAPDISSDGRYVAFPSDASNLVLGDTNARRDAFVRDRQAQTTVRVSVNDSGTQGNLSSGSRTISTDGRYVAFLSYATDLVPGDTNNLEDVFVHDLQSGKTTRISMSSSGGQGNAPVFGSASISADGRYVAFESGATNLLASSDTNSEDDVFVALNRLEPVAYSSMLGTDRYDTAIKISKAMFPGTLPPDSGLVLAPGESYQEALCGAPLAAAYGGPVLLTPKVGLNNAVRAEIVRLAPKYVVCIGLSDGIMAAVQTALGATGTASVIRGGNDCVYDMSEQVARALAAKVGGLTGATAIITRGDMFPDAIGVAPLACAKKWPILLTGNATGALWDDAATALTDLGMVTALKVGTYVTLPPAVTGLANLSGADRYVTNRNVALWGKAAGGLASTHTGLATGDKFPDALAAGPYVAVDKGVLLLTPLFGPLPGVISAEVGSNAHAVDHFSFIAMIEAVRNQVRALLQ